MSWQATSAVITYSTHKGSELLCLIMLSNYAGPHGENIWPSIPSLARDCRMSERGVRYIIDKLKDSGELMEDGIGLNNVRKYRLNVSVFTALQTLQPCKIEAQALQNMPSSPAIAIAYKPPIEQSEEQPKEDALFSLNQDNSEEKKEKEKKEKPATPFAAAIAALPPEYDTPEFREAFEGFAEMRKRKYPLTPRAIALICRDLAKWGVAKAIEALDSSTRRDWRDVFEPSQKQPYSASKDQNRPMTLQEKARRAC